jgi:hypothetical protein
VISLDAPSDALREVLVLIGYAALIWFVAVPAISTLWTWREGRGYNQLHGLNRGHLRARFKMWTALAWNITQAFRKAPWLAAAILAAYLAAQLITWVGTQFRQ